MFVDVDPDDTNALRLSESDVSACREIIERVRRSRLPAKRVRAEIFNAALDLVNAQDWLWAYGAAQPDHPTPINLDHQYFGGNTLWGRSEYLKRVFGVYGIPPENEVLHDVYMSVQRFAFTQRTVVRRSYWDSKSRREYAIRCGFDDVIHVGCVNGTQRKYRLFSALIVWRRTGLEPFQYREAAILYFLFMNLQCCCGPGRNREWLKNISLLSPVLRVAKTAIVGGLLAAEAARYLHLSPEGARSQYKRVTKTVADLMSARSLRAVLGFGSEDNSMREDSVGNDKPPRS